MDRLRASLGVGGDKAKSTAPPASDASLSSVSQREVADSTVVDGSPRGAATASAAAKVSFSLLLATCGRWLWLELLEDGLVRREQLQLIHAMSQAIDGPDVKLTHRQFDWPIASHPHLPKDLGAARQSVAGQAMRLVKDAGAEGLIVLGSESAQYLAEGPLQQRAQIPATLEMLRDPSLKKLAWQVLKPLKATP